MQTAGEFFSHLGIPTGYERWLIDGPSRTDVVTEELKGKSAKRNRLVTHPSPHAIGLEDTLKLVSKFLTAEYDDSIGIAHGFVPGRSTYSNAKIHTNSDVILTIDVSSFFNSILTSTSLSGLQRQGVSPEISNSIVKLCSPFGSLPVGFSTSPPLSNWACAELDAEILTFAVSRGLRVSRYVDDISISCQLHSGKFLTDADLRALVEIVSRHGFTIAGRKTRFLRRGKSQVVTGYSVSDGDLPRIPRSAKKRLSNIVHMINKFGAESTAQRLGVSQKKLEEIISGKISYMKLAEPAFVERISLQLKTRV